MDIKAGHVITTMFMFVLWVVCLIVFIGCDHHVYVSNLDDANASESTPSATPTNQLPTIINRD